jgi:hypothetical protein
MLIRNLRRIVFVLAAVVLAIPVRAEEPFIIGTCTHFAQAKGDPPQNLRMILDAGIRSIRDDVQVQTIWRW